MIEYLAAAWLLSCSHLGPDDPANPAPEHPMKFSRQCHPLAPQSGIETRTIVDIIGGKWPGWCVKNTSDRDVGYVAVVYFGEHVQVEMSSTVKPCDASVS